MSNQGRATKKPVTIDYCIWTGSNADEVELFAGEAYNSWMPSNEQIELLTLEGPFIASKGDVIIRGVKGEIYPCKPDIFEATYDDISNWTGGEDEVVDVNGAFASGDHKVINWGGENFYKACGEPVTENPLTGASSCVKREDHPGDIHEDWDGNRKAEEQGKYVIVVTVPLKGTLLELHSEVQEVMAALKAELSDKEGRQVYNAVKDKADQLVMILEGSG